MPQLYDRWADLWAVLSPVEDYEPEASRLLARIGEYLESQAARPTALELGSGVGHGLASLKHDLDLTAVDIAPAMLARSAALHPDIRHIQGDMRSVRLGRTFDVVLLYDAVEYMTTRSDARAAVATAAAHLRPGGLLLLAPTYVTETLPEPVYAADSRAVESLELSYVSLVTPAADAEACMLSLLIALRQDGQATVLRDRHDCGLFPADAWRGWLDACGLALIEDPLAAQDGVDGSEMDDDASSLLFVARRRG